MPEDREQDLPAPGTNCSTPMAYSTRAKEEHLKRSVVTTADFERDEAIHKPLEVLVRHFHGMDWEG